MLAADAGLRGRFACTETLPPIGTWEAVDKLRGMLTDPTGLYRAADPPFSECSVCKATAADVRGCAAATTTAASAPATADAGVAGIDDTRAFMSSVSRSSPTRLRAPAVCSAGAIACAAGSVANCVDRLRCLLGEEFRNLADVERIAAEIDAALASRLQASIVRGASAAAGAAAAASAAAGTSTSISGSSGVDLLTAALKAWNPRRYENDDVFGACEALVATAQDAATARAGDNGGAAAQQTDAAAVPMPQMNRAAGNYRTAQAPPPAATRTTTRTAVAAPPYTATASEAALEPGEDFPVALLPLLGVLSDGVMGIYRRRGGAFEYADLLDGRNATAAAVLMASLRDANASQGIGASEGDLQSLFDKTITDARARLARDTAAFSADSTALRQRAADRMREGDVEAAMALDADMRVMCETVTTTVTETRWCSICNRLDTPGSGCTYAGRSPVPYSTTVTSTAVNRTYTQG